MKILQIHTLLSVGDFEDSKAYQKIEKDIIAAIKCIKNPPQADGFYLLKKKKGNGVTPIKNAFIQELDDSGWKNERICDSTIKPRK